jgi:hypothetical protein
MRAAIVVRRTSRIVVDHSWQASTPLKILGYSQKVFQRDCHDGHLSVIVGQEPHHGTMRWHLSISHRTNQLRPKPGRYPHWDEIADARYRFVPDDVTMAMILPPSTEYVNLHNTVFHLHEIVGEEMF